MLTTLARASIEGALLVAVIWSVCRLLPRMPPAVRAALWWCAAAKFVVALVWIAPLSLPILPPPAQKAAMPEPAIVARLEVRDAAARTDSKEAADAARQAVGLDRARNVMLAIWVAGFAAAAGIGLMRWGQTRAVVRRARPAPEPIGALAAELAGRLRLRRAPAVRVSDEVSTPLVTGLLRPVALLPDAFERLPGEQQRMALCHELAHVKRADLWLGCAPALAERLFFFHPLVRLAAREYAFWREAACDAAVLEVLDAPPQDYGRLLLDLGISRPEASLAAAGASWSIASLKRRIAMLGHPPVRSLSSRVIASAAVLAAAAALVPIEITARQPLPAPAAPPSVSAWLPGLSAAASLTAPPVPGLPTELAPQDRGRRNDKDNQDELNFVLFRDENTTTMSGRMSDIRRAREFKRRGEPLLWFRHGGKEYIVRDRGLMSEVEAAWVPVNELGDQQGVLGSRQGELGEEQGRLGERQGELGEEQGQLGERQGRLGERQAELADREGKLRTARDREAFEREGREIEREMRELDLKMRELDVRMRELDSPMRELDVKMQALDKEMEVLDRQMEAATRAAERAMRAVIERAIATGAAEEIKR